MNILDHLALEMIRLNDKINSTRLPNEAIEVEHKALLAESQLLTDATAVLLNFDGMECSPHDMFIRNFSQRRQVNDRKIKFDIDTIGYRKGDVYHGHQSWSSHGYQPISFEMNSKDDLRVAAGREIYQMIIDEEQCKMLVVFHDARKLRHVVIGYSELKIGHGKFKPWKDNW